MKKFVCLLMVAMLVLAMGVTAYARAIKCECGGNCVARNIKRESDVVPHYSHWDTVETTTTDYICQDCGNLEETTVVTSTYCPYE